MSANPFADAPGNCLGHITRLDRSIRLELRAARLDLAFAIQNHQLRIIQFKRTQHFRKIIRILLSIQLHELLKVIRSPCGMIDHMIFNRLIVVGSGSKGKNNLHHKERNKYYYKIVQDDLASNSSFDH
ncbi:hypothetical protein D3C77_459230 [compost metagenome]